MRVGFISTYPPIECGIATYTEALERALRRTRTETFVVSPYGAQGENVFGIYPAASDAFASLVFRTSVNLNPDLIHLQHEYGLYGSQRGVAVIDLLLRYRLVRVPTVTTLHTVYEEIDESTAVVVRAIVEHSSAVIVHEEYQKEALLRACPSATPDSIHVIEHGVRELEPVPAAKGKLGLDGKKALLLCGYYRPTKGFHRVADFFPRIAERVDDVVLVVAGKSRNVEFDDYRRELLAVLRASPAAGRIVILQGQFPQHTFDTIVSAADVVLLPYEKGAQSGILSQCLAFGRPVVASGLRAFREVVERSGGGLIAETDAEFVSASIRLLRDGSLRTTCRESVRTYVERQGGWSRVAAKHSEVYEGLLAPGREGARPVYFPQPETDVETML